MTITTANQDVLASWLCKRIGLTPTADLGCIGRLNSNGEIIAVVGFDGYNGASVMMHVAGEGNWLSRHLLWVAFNYAFSTMKCNVVLGLVPCGNIAALRLNGRLGFRLAVTLPCAHPDGALMVLSMTRQECRFLGAHADRRETATLQ